jgi:hypothetical protein
MKKAIQRHCREIACSRNIFRRCVNAHGLAIRPSLAWQMKCENNNIEVYPGQHQTTSKHYPGPGVTASELAGVPGALPGGI